MAHCRVWVSCHVAALVITNYVLVITIQSRWRHLLFHVHCLYHNYIGFRMRMWMTLNKPDCVSNYCELHAKHGKLPVHACLLFACLSIYAKMTRNPIYMYSRSTKVKSASTWPRTVWWYTLLWYSSSESVSTLMYAREFLKNVDSSGQLFNYTAINLTALRAQDLSQAAISQVHVHVNH